LKGIVNSEVHSDEKEEEDRELVRYTPLSRPDDGGPREVEEEEEEEKEEEEEEGVEPVARQLLSHCLRVCDKSNKLSNTTVESWIP
jgi:hypothetical protein